MTRSPNQKFCMSYYPIYLDLRNRQCLVVGAGYVGTGKVAGLLEAKARVMVVAPEASDKVATWAAQGALIWQRRKFEASDIGAAFIVIAATDNKALNAQVYQLANRQQRVANAVDDLDNCNFIAPAIVRDGPVQIAVSTSGTSPGLAKQLRDRIQDEILEPHTGKLAHFLGGWRKQVKRMMPSYQDRLVFWEGVLASAVPQLIADGEMKRAHVLLNEQLHATAHILSEQPRLPTNRTSHVEWRR